MEDNMYPKINELVNSSGVKNPELEIKCANKIE